MEVGIKFLYCIQDAFTVFYAHDMYAASVGRVFPYSIIQVGLLLYYWNKVFVQYSLLCGAVSSESQFKLLLGLREAQAGALLPFTPSRQHLLVLPPLHLSHPHTKGAPYFNLCHRVVVLNEKEIVDQFNSNNKKLCTNI